MRRVSALATVGDSSDSVAREYGFTPAHLFSRGVEWSGVEWSGVEWRHFFRSVAEHAVRVGVASSPLVAVREGM